MSTAAAQACKGDVDLTMQATVEAFACERVDGSLTVRGAVGDLGPLSRLREVAGTLDVNGTRRLATRTGLDGLRSVWALSVRHNDAPCSLGGLGGLEPTISGAVTIAYNDSLRTLAGLAPLTAVGWLTVRGLLGNEITDVEALASLSSVGGGVLLASAFLWTACEGAGATWSGWSPPPTRRACTSSG